MSPLPFDGLGNIGAWNQAAVEMFGITSNDAVSRPCAEVICGSDGDGIVCLNECVV